MAGTFRHYFAKFGLHLSMHFEVNHEIEHPFLWSFSDTSIQGVVLSLEAGGDFRSP